MHESLPLCKFSGRAILAPFKLLFSARPAGRPTGRAIEKILVGTIGLEPTTPTMSR